MKKNISFYLLIAHGSREKKTRHEVLQLVRLFQKAYPDCRTTACFLEILKPSISEAIEACIREGAEEIFVIPLMIFTGRHVKEDIPRILECMKAQFPDVDFHYSTPLADHPLLLQILEEKARSADRI